MVKTSGKHSIRMGCSEHIWCGGYLYLLLNTFMKACSDSNITMHEGITKIGYINSDISKIFHYWKSVRIWLRWQFVECLICMGRMQTSREVE